MATIKKRELKHIVTWQARVKRKDYPVQYRTFDLKGDAEAWARRIEREIDVGAWRDTSGADTSIFGDALRRYLVEVTPNKKGARQEEMRPRIILRHKIATTAISRLKNSDVAAFRDDMLHEGKAPSTVLKYMALMSYLFTVAQTECGMPYLINPVQSVRKPRANNKRDRRLEPEEEARLLAACGDFHNSNTWLLPMVLFALETAMRKGEILNLTWKNVELKKTTATLLDTKNGECRTVPLSSKAISILKSLPRSPGGRVFATTGNAIKLAFIRTCKRAKSIDGKKNEPIEDLRFHDLRHEATSRLFEKGLSTEQVKRITGHKTYAMLGRYTHLRVGEEMMIKLG